MPAPHLNRCPHCNGPAEFVDLEPCEAGGNCLQDSATAVRCTHCGARPFVAYAAPEIAHAWLAYRWNRRGYMERRA